MSNEQQDRYLHLAKQAIAYVKSKIPFGSNSRAGSAVPGWDPQRALVARQFLFATVQHVLKVHGVISEDEYNDIIVMVMEHFAYGQCAEQARAAYVYLKNLMVEAQCIGSLDVCETTEGRHQLVVLGREQDSDPNDKSTWGKSAVVCDPWAEKVYPLSDFEEMQKPEHEVLYADMCYAGAAMPHYLAGSLISLQRYDNTVCVAKSSSMIAADATVSFFGHRSISPPKSASISASMLSAHENRLPQPSSK